MNETSPAVDLITRIAGELAAYQSLCEKLLALVTQENLALAAGADFQPFISCQERKNLLPQFEKALISLRACRLNWENISRPGRVANSEVKKLFQAVQGLVMRILVLDRDNQQALLRRGLVPARHLPPAAGQQPNYVTKLYQRHAQA